MTTNSGMYVGKEEHLLIVGGNANWYRNYKNQCRKDRHRFTTISSCTMLQSQQPGSRNDLDADRLKNGKCKCDTFTQQTPAKQNYCINR